MTEEPFRYAFFGRVLPENHPLSMGQISLRVESPFVDFDLVWKIQQNHIVAVAFVDTEIDDILTLRNLVKNRIQSSIDGMSFLIGRPYEVVLEYYSTPAGQYSTLIPDIDVVKNQSQPDEKVEIGQKMLTVLYETPGSKPLELALADFSNAMTDASATPFHCQRAFDSLCQYFIEEFDLDPNSSERWDRMWGELDHDNTYIVEEIVPKAKDRRHGKDVEVSAHERAEMFQQTWTVLMKYIDYQLRKYDPPQIDVALII